MQFPCGRRIPGVHVCNTPAGAPTGIDLLYGFHQLVSRQGVDLAALETCISGMLSSSGRNCRRCSTLQATNLLIVSSHSCDFGVPASVARERTSPPSISTATDRGFCVFVDIIPLFDSATDTPSTGSEGQSICLLRGTGRHSWASGRGILPWTLQIAVRRFPHFRKRPVWAR